MFRHKNGKNHIKKGVVFLIIKEKKPVAFIISLFLFGSELFYVLIVTHFFRDKSIENYFNYFKIIKLIFFILTCSWIISSYTFVRMVFNSYLFFRPEQEKDAKRKLFNKNGLTWPEGDEFRIVIGEIHDGPPAGDNKKWLVMDEYGLYTSLLIIGATGTGKTSGCAYPFLEQLMSCKKNLEEEKIGGLILDGKGDFWQGAYNIMKDNGRERDLIIIEPGSGWYYNPVHHPSLDSKIIAERLYSVLENLNSSDGRQDSFWKDKSINLLSHTLNLIRICFRYVTLKDVHDVVSDEQKLSELIEYSRNLMEKGKINGENTEEALYSISYFEGADFKWLDERTKAIIKSESLRVCSDFIKPLYRETFCTEEKKLNFPGFQDAINNGKIILLRMPESSYGLTGRMIGVMLKLDYFRNVLNRVYAHAAGMGINMKRPVLFLCDEYQNFATSGDMESDAEFFARCRQSKGINIVLTQSYSSLKQRLGSEEKLNAIIGNIRSTIWLSLADDYSREKASKICDKEYKLKITENITEQDDRALYNPYIGGLLSDNNTLSQGTTRTYEKNPSFDTDDFANLMLNQGIYRIYSGSVMKGPGIVYLHPIYRPKTRGYFDN